MDGSGADGLMMSFRAELWSVTSKSDLIKGNWVIQFCCGCSAALLGNPD